LRQIETPGTRPTFDLLKNFVAFLLSSEFNLLKKLQNFRSPEIRRYNHCPKMGKLVDFFVRRDTFPWIFIFQQQ
jgi:hypothetical protein